MRLTKKIFLVLALLGWFGSVAAQAASPFACGKAMTGDHGTDITQASKAVATPISAAPSTSSPCPHSQRPAPRQGDASGHDHEQAAHQSHGTAAAQDTQTTPQDSDDHSQDTCRCLMGGCHLGKVLMHPVAMATVFDQELTYAEAYLASLRVNRPDIHLPPPRRSLLA